MRRVTATIPTYWEDQFEEALKKSGLDGPEFVRTAVYVRVQELLAPANTENHEVFDTEPREQDLYMKSAPEALKVLSKVADTQVCLRGQEIGEDHIIEPGQLFAWVRFSRDSQPADWVKNGKLCKDCTEIAREMWANGKQYF